MKMEDNSLSIFDQSKGLVIDNAVVELFKLILLNYNNFSIVKKVVNKIERVKQPKVVSQRTRN